MNGECGGRKIFPASAAAGRTRKGPWASEEDLVLIEYVKLYGPRDWSCIQSKGLLPRTGKSCRLRWVNKLKPDLKTGCKFSAEEERVVIDLQAKFGNKWAKIASFLPGRTHNDVKNLWSTRKKRLAKLVLHSTVLPVREFEDFDYLRKPFDDQLMLPGLEPFDYPLEPFDYELMLPSLEPFDYPLESFDGQLMLPSLEPFDYPLEPFDDHLMLPSLECSLDGLLSDDELISLESFFLDF